MRILSIGFMYPPHDLGGGYEVTWLSAVRHMRSAGDEVRVLTTDFRNPGIPEDREVDSDVHRTLRWYWEDHRFPRRTPRERLALERHNAAVLARHLQELRPDAVNWWGMGGMSLGLVERVRRLGLPAVGVVGDEWLRWGPRADAWIRPFRRLPPIARAAERLTGVPAQVDFDDAAVWLFNSERVRADALGAHPGLRRTAVLHPGIDDRLFEAADPRPWGWRLLYLGRLDPRKGVHLAVEALAELPADATLVLQGDGDADYVERLEGTARRLGVEDRLRFSREPRNRLPAVFADADAVLFPVQWEEPWGLVPLEAMAVGRPVVATGTGGSAEYLQDGENSLIFRPRDSPAALAAAVRRLAGEPELRERLREHGRRTAGRFTETAYNEAIRSALEDAVARGRRPQG